MKLGFLILIITLALALTTLCQASQRSKRWVLKLENHEAMDANSLDQLAQQIAREHKFKLLRQVGDIKGYYMAEFNETHLDALKAGPGESHHHVRRKREALVSSAAEQLKSHPAVADFVNEKILVRTKRDFMDMPDDMGFGSKQHRGQAMAFHARPLKGGKRRNVGKFGMIRPLAADSAGARLPNIIHDEDPMWPQMWYLNRNMYNPTLPDMNVTAAWAQGFSGRGISVTFLDDGLEWNHPDLMVNYDPKASTDINGNSNDPMPRYDDTNENKHGTRCAGEVAAVANNSVCSVGIAFNSGIGGIRMLDGDVTDSVEASSLAYNTQHIHIYSASWGPDDNGEVVDGPGPLAKKAFIEGALKGRNGLGSIFVWASGNGGRFNDSCACDGYANSIYTLSISSTTESGDKPWYLEECTSTLATSYSSGNERAGEREIMTTDIRHKCTSKHTGTSAAAPLAAGIIALCLEANPTLTWRDIMFLTVLSSRAEVIRSNNYIVNKRGFLVSNRYGFGLMDAGRMVELAKNWTNVPAMQTCSTLNSVYKINSVYQVDSIETTITTDACKGTVNEVNFIEQVEIVVTIQAPVRGQLEIYLTSPMGTKSLILPKRPKDVSRDGFKRWPFMTVQLWGELPHGDWKLLVKSNTINDIRSVVHLEDINLIIHGTKEKPIEYERLMRVNPSTIVGITDEAKNLTKFLNCHYQCDNTQQPCGPTESDCLKCKYYQLESENKIKCVSYCPIGFYADAKKKACIKCHPSCLDCTGPSGQDCLTCKSDEDFLMTSPRGCVKSCPVNEGYFLNIDKQCEPCEANCKSCMFSANYCLECTSSGQAVANAKTGKNETYTFKLKENNCVAVRELGDSAENYEDSCSLGTFLNTLNNKCESCDINCDECSNAPAVSQDGSTVKNNCVSCMKNRPYLTPSGRCVKDCGAGYYLNQTMSRCLKCESNCAECSEVSLRLDEAKSKSVVIETGYVCLKCDAGYEMTKDNGCTSSYFYENDCVDKNCFECFGKKAKQCRVCKDDFALNDGQCVLNATEGYFKKQISTPSGIIQVLDSCSDNCAACQNENRCTQCMTGQGVQFQLSNGTCQVKCGEKEYKIDAEQVESYYDQLVGAKSDYSNYCKPCVEPCEKCLNSTYCMSCQDKAKVLFRGKCLLECPEGYYREKSSVGNNGLCRSCHYSCSTCKGRKDTDCTACHFGYSFLDQKCASNCPTGSYYDKSSSSCLICNAQKSMCKECIETPQRCTECLPGYGLDSSSSECKKCCNERLLLETMSELSANRNLVINKTLTDCCKCERNADKMSTFVCVDESLAAKVAPIETSKLLTDANKFESFLLSVLGKLRSSSSSDQARLNRILELRYALRIVSIVLMVVAGIFLVIGLFTFWRTCRLGKDTARFGEYSLINTNNNNAIDEAPNGHVANEYTDKAAASSSTAAADGRSLYDNEKDQTT